MHCVLGGGAAAASSPAAAHHTSGHAARLLSLCSVADVPVRIVFKTDAQSIGVGASHS